VKGTCELRLDASPFVQSAASCWMATVRIHIIICWLVGSASDLVAFISSDTTFELVCLGKLEYKPAISSIEGATVSLSASVIRERYLGHHNETVLVCE
jgi:hypothetical protein